MRCFFFSFQHFKWHVTAGYSKSSTGLWSPSCNIVARLACVKDLSLPLSLCRSGTLIGGNVLDNWFEDILLHALRARQVMRCLPLLMSNNTEALLMIAREHARVRSSYSASCSSYIRGADIYYGKERQVFETEFKCGWKCQDLKQAPFFLSSAFSPHLLIFFNKMV